MPLCTADKLHCKSFHIMLLDDLRSIRLLSMRRNLPTSYDRPSPVVALSRIIIPRRIDVVRFSAWFQAVQSSA